MGLYKELHYELAALADKQVQVYPDAADAGVLVSGAADPLCLKVRALLEGDHYAGSLKKTRGENIGSVYGFVFITFNIPWEYAEGTNGQYYICTVWEVGYCFDKRRNVRYLSFNSRSANVRKEDIYIS